MLTNVMTESKVVIGNDDEKKGRCKGILTLSKICLREKNRENEINHPHTFEPSSQSRQAEPSEPPSTNDEKRKYASNSPFLPLKKSNTDALKEFPDQKSVTSQRSLSRYSLLAKIERMFYIPFALLPA